MSDIEDLRLLKQYREALEAIAGPCATTTAGNCFATSGRAVGAEYGADAVCDQCIANRALGRLSFGKETGKGMAIEAVNDKIVALERITTILTTLAEGWASAREEMEAFGIGGSVGGLLNMQVYKSWFMDHITKYEVDSAWGEEHKELSVVLRGVKVFCLVGKPAIKEEARDESSATSS